MTFARLRIAVQEIGSEHMLFLPKIPILPVCEVVIAGYHAQFLFEVFYGRWHSICGQTTFGLAFYLLSFAHNPMHKLCGSKNRNYDVIFRIVTSSLGYELFQVFYGRWETICDRTPMGLCF